MPAAWPDKAYIKACRAMARSLATADAALGSATALRADALRLALEDFSATLRAHASGALAAAPAPGSESAASSPSRGRDTPLAGAPRALRDLIRFLKG